jgi:hypothetical protein
MRRLVLLTLVLGAGCAAQPQDIRSTITPEAIAAATEPLLFFELTEGSQQAIMSLAGRNGEVVTWSTADDRSISLLNGVLVATRGFGYDLMVADVSGTLAALNGSNREYEKFLSFLDGENRQLFQSFFCEMAGPEREVIDSFGRTVDVLKWTETCLGSQSELTSIFWVSQGLIYRTDQAVSQQFGTLITERLNE